MASSSEHSSNPACFTKGRGFLGYLIVRLRYNFRDNFTSGLSNANIVDFCICSDSHRPSVNVIGLLAGCLKAADDKFIM